MWTNQSLHGKNPIRIYDKVRKVQKEQKEQCKLDLPSKEEPLTERNARFQDSMNSEHKSQQRVIMNSPANHQNSQRIFLRRLMWRC